MAVVHVAFPNPPPVSLDNREQLSLLCLVAWPRFLVLVRGSLGSKSKKSSKKKKKVEKRS